MFRNFQNTRFSESFTINIRTIFVTIISHYVKLPLAKIARIVFKKLNALWHLFLNSICQRLATPKKAKPFALNYNSRIRGKSRKIFFYDIFVNLSQEYKIFPGSNPRSKISIHLFTIEL